MQWQHSEEQFLVDLRLIRWMTDGGSHGAADVALLGILTQPVQAGQNQCRCDHDRQAWQRSIRLNYEKFYMCFPLLLLRYRMYSWPEIYYFQESNGILFEIYFLREFKRVLSYQLLHLCTRVLSTYLGRVRGCTLPK